ncbi:hypothetical protein J6590_083670 [Homalodisca vitripennis]|nr:hypothetical protein J6590_083670 [Homalodisca vitripennis]
MNSVDKWIKIQAFPNKPATAPPSCSCLVAPLRNKAKNRHLACPNTGLKSG